MNYYQNQYANNQFGNQYGAMPYQQPYVQSTLCGKIVDSEEIVRIQELMPGQIGVYPKFDESCIYLKKWGQGGATTIVTYVPVVNNETEEDNTLVSIQESIKEISDKIDKLNVAPAPAPRVSMARAKNKEA